MFLMYLTPKKPSYLAGLDQAMSYAQRVRKLAWTASRHLPIDASCLRQSLLIWWLLLLRGLAAEYASESATRRRFLPMPGSSSKDAW